MNYKNMTISSKPQNFKKNKKQIRIIQNYLVT